MLQLLPLLVAMAAPQDSVALYERVDLYDPVSGAFLGAETTWFGFDGRRLRAENTDPDGETTLLFLVRHDVSGRESEAIYFEGDSQEPDREVFEYSDDGRLKTTTYYFEPGVRDEWTESDLDAAGREFRKRYFRADGSQYGEEDVLWREDGSQLGWDFRYVERSESVSFRYEYVDTEPGAGWVRRIRSRDGVAERLEVRSRVFGSHTPLLRPTPARFGGGAVSSAASEASPSFTADGQTLVFARYDGDWDSKRAWMAERSEAGWITRELTELGSVYNLTISPDGQSIVYATQPGRRGWRVTRAGDGWSVPEDLTGSYGVRGTYLHLTAHGDLWFFDADGGSGAGIYRANSAGIGFEPAAPVYTPSGGTTFDAFPYGSASFVVTRCLDDTCGSGSGNGFWVVPNEVGGDEVPRWVPELPYGWGGQAVPSLGLFVFTDGEDILAVPLASVDLSLGN